MKTPFNAVSHNNIEEIRALVSQSISENDASEALGFAACLGNTQCVALLLPMSNAKQHDSGPLRMAAAKGHVECVKLLTPFSDSNAREGEPLKFAAHNGHAQCVKLLIPVTDSKWYTEALYFAALHGNEQSVTLLYKHCTHTHDVLKDLKINYPQAYKKLVILERCIQADHINKALNTQLDPNARAKTMRKI